jgi:hypothetical protein
MRNRTFQWLVAGLMAHDRQHLLYETGSGC